LLGKMASLAEAAEAGESSESNCVMQSLRGKIIFAELNKPIADSGDSAKSVGQIFLQFFAEGVELQADRNA
jgi:hypothetical protein